MISMKLATNDLYETGYEWSLWNSLRMISMKLATNDLYETRYEWSLWNWLRMISMKLATNDLYEAGYEWSLWNWLRMISMKCRYAWYVSEARSKGSTVMSLFSYISTCILISCDKVVIRDILIVISDSCSCFQIVHNV